MHVKTPTLKRYKAEDCEFVNLAFVIVQMGGKSLGIDLSLDTQCIESYICWSYQEDFQLCVDF